jgi:hypothetical protein
MDDLLLTCSVPEWGDCVLNVGKNAAYEAARRGEIPTIQVGGKLRVPVRVAIRPFVENGADVEALLAQLRRHMSRKATPA